MLLAWNGPSLSLLDQTSIHFFCPPSPTPTSATSRERRSSTRRTMTSLGPSLPTPRRAPQRPPQTPRTVRRGTALVPVSACAHARLPTTAVLTPFHVSLLTLRSTRGRRCQAVANVSPAPPEPAMPCLLSFFSPSFGLFPAQPVRSVGRRAEACGRGDQCVRCRHSLGAAGE